MKLQYNLKISIAEQTPPQNNWPRTQINFLLTLTIPNVFNTFYC